MNMVNKVDGWVAGKVNVGREIMTIDNNNGRHILGRVTEIEKDAKGRAKVAITDKGVRQGLLGKPGNGRRALIWSRD